MALARTVNGQGDRKSDRNYYLALCARKYAEVTRQLRLAEDAQQRKKLTELLSYLKESAIYETELEIWLRRRHLPEDLQRESERKADFTRAITPAEAEALRHLCAVPGGGLLGTLSSVEMELLADLYEGWSCTTGLDRLSTIRLLGLADAMRLMAGFLGPDHEPHDPPARSISRFIYYRAFGSKS
jgi:hypothetical protein